MKRLIFLLLLIPFLVKAQYPTYGYKLANDSLFVAQQTATDSIYFTTWRQVVGGSVTFDFTNVDAQDATIKFGYSPDGIVLIPASNGDFTLDNTDSDLECYTFETDAYFDDVDTCYCKSFTKDNWSYNYIGWFFSKGSLTNDTIVVRFTK